MMSGGGGELCQHGSRDGMQLQCKRGGKNEVTCGHLVRLRNETDWLFHSRTLRFFVVCVTLGVGFAELALFFFFCVLQPLPTLPPQFNFKDTPLISSVRVSPPNLTWATERVERPPSAKGDDRLRMWSWWCSQELCHCRCARWRGS